MPILIADKGHTFPLDLLNGAAKFGATQWGVAVLRKGTLVTKSITEPLDVKEFDGIQKQFKDENFIFTLQKGDVKEEEQQPFTILRMESGTKPPLVVACLNGSFPNYDGSIAKTVSEFLQPKLVRVFNKQGSDMAKLWKAIEDEEFRELVESVCRPDGTIALMAANGQCIFYNVNKEAVKTPFGFATDLFGVKAESLQAPAKSSALGDLADDDAAAEPEKTVPEETEKDPKEEVKENEKKSIPDANQQLKPEDYVWVKPKKDSGAKAVDNFYHKVCTHIGIKKDTVAMVREKPAMRVTKEFFKTIHQMAEVVSPPKESKYQAFEAPTAIGDALKAASDKTAMPKLEVSSLKFIKEELKLQPAASDDVLQGLEKKYPSYFQLGHSWDEIKKWPFANFVSLASDPEAVALLCWTLTRKMNSLEPRLAAQIREMMEQKQEKIAM